MTVAERIAAEHIAWRRANGATWAEIMEEAELALRMLGLRPMSIGYAAVLERAFATAWASTQRAEVAA